jgi:microcin C transport system substrate-binding protein
MICFPIAQSHRIKTFFVTTLVMLLVTTGAAMGRPMHGVAMHGEPKYGPNFQHFDYVNPNAPKEGIARFAQIGSFDSLNPFIIKGQPAVGLGLLFERLATSSADEAFSQYGLIAETIDISEDRSSVTYTLRPQARFHDGSPITADDVIFSYEILKTKGSPFYRFYYANVAKVEKLGERRVKFSFAPGDNRELPLIMGQLPVLSKAYWEERNFEAATLAPPVGSGPYQIARHEPGRFIVYQRDPDYWGADLPVNRGLYNFDYIRYDYYRDTTVALEAFKANAYDIRPENTAKLWATGYESPALEQGLIEKIELPNQLPSGMQGFAFNIRRPLFQDPRVRQALSYAFDYEWTNRNLFYNQYTRTKSYFDNSELASRNLPSQAELAILQPLREEIPAEVFTTPFQPPIAGNSKELRENLLKALALLQEAGWTFANRKLVNSETKRPFRFEILLNAPTWERIALAFVRNLERLGIEARVRTVDSAQYENRVRNYNFDMIVQVWGQSLSPGNEQREYWGSESADLPGSRNVVGIKDPAIDKLIEQVIAAPDRKALITRVRALDRVLLWNHFVIPHWHTPYDRIAYWDKFGRPAVIPMQGTQTLAWWVNAQKAASLPRRRAALKR